MIKIKIPENLAEKIPPHYPNAATQRNVFIGGVLHETKDHLPGTITVSFDFFSVEGKPNPLFEPSATIETYEKP